MYSFFGFCVKVTEKTSKGAFSVSFGIGLCNGQKLENIK